jgi:hypothetical protein
LREGGSLPALAEADDDFKYVFKIQGSWSWGESLIDRRGDCACFKVTDSG